MAGLALSALNTLGALLDIGVEPLGLDIAADDVDVDCPFAERGAMGVADATMSFRLSSMAALVLAVTGASDGAGAGAEGGCSEAAGATADLFWAAGFGSGSAAAIDDDNGLC